ncbi:hypothetical protein ACFL2V_16545, partial [Pseudomonadota bacterium]
GSSYAEGNEAYVYVWYRDVLDHVSATTAQDDIVYVLDSTPPTVDSVKLDTGAVYAILNDHVDVSFGITDDAGVTGYFISEHNATNPMNIVPPVLDPLISDANWVSVTETASLELTVAANLSGTYAKGDTIRICVWGIDGVDQISLSACDDIRYAVNWESSWGKWFPSAGVWQIGTPTAGPTECYSATQCAGTQLDGNYDRWQDSRLQGGQANLPTAQPGEELQLRFWHWFSYSTYDSGQVQIQVWDENSQTWGSWTTIGNSFTGVSQGWVPMVIDVSDYAGEKVRLGFLHTADSNCGACATESSGWFVDDIPLSCVAAHWVPL